MSFLHSLEYSPTKAADFSVKIYLLSLKSHSPCCQKTSCVLSVSYFSTVQNDSSDKKLKLYYFSTQFLERHYPHARWKSPNETDVTQIQDTVQFMGEFENPVGNMGRALHLSIIFSLVIAKTNTKFLVTWWCYSGLHACPHANRTTCMSHSHTATHAPFFTLDQDYVHQIRMKTYRTSTWVENIPMFIFSTLVTVKVREYSVTGCFNKINKENGNKNMHRFFNCYAMNQTFKKFIAFIDLHYYSQQKHGWKCIARLWVMILSLCCTTVLRCPDVSVK